MPRRLSATFVRSVKPADRPRSYGDGRGGFGLTLGVTPNGVKYWSKRIRIKDRYTNIALGGYPLVTLAEAREAALANTRAARTGGDPAGASRECPPSPRRRRPSSSGTRPHGVIRIGCAPPGGPPSSAMPLRSSASAWAGSPVARSSTSSAPHAVMEAALAHVVSNKVEAAYFRSDLLEKRRELMQQWADYLLPPETHEKAAVERPRKRAAAFA